MTPREIASLLAYLGRLDPRLIRTDTGEARDQIDQWHELLGDVPLATAYGWDACVVARAHILESPYPILPVDIARKWRAYRRDRLQRHTDPTPAADPDDQAAWQAELAATRQAVACGAAAPTTHRQITGQIQPDLNAGLKQIGRYIPKDARKALAPYRPARAAREAAIAQGQPDPLGVRCPWCDAPVGTPCRLRRMGPGDGAHGYAPKATPHPRRVELAAQQAEQRQQSATN